MKKIRMTVMLMLCALIVAACGNSSNGTSGPADSGAGGNEAAGGARETVRITFGEVLAEDHPLAQGSYRFAELVKEKSNGSIVIDIFPNQQLGSLRELVEQTSMGTIQITRGIVSTLAGFVPELDVLQFPYLLPSSEQGVWDMMDGEVGETILGSFDHYGLHALGFWPQGFKHITANDSILTPEDMKGVKMRVVPSNILLKQFEAWGATPVAIDFAELYTSLQQGVVNAQENPVDSILSMKMYEVQDDLMIYNHSYQFNLLVMNKEFLEKLTPEQQAIIQSAHDEVTAEYRANYLAQNESIMQTLQDNGMTIHELNEEQIGAFKTLSEPLHDSLVTSPEQQDMLNLIRSYQP